MTNTANFYFLFDDFANDTISAIDGLPITAVSPQTLASTLPGIFWIETDVNGDSALCMTKVVGQQTTLTVNSGNYTSTPIPFVPVPDYNGIIGPHPTVIFKPGPRK